MKKLMLVALLLISCETDWAGKDVEERYCGWCVMHDNAGTWWLKSPEKDYEYVDPFEIYYRKYLVGDTIKCSQKR